MKRKILWMLLSFLLVAALVLASCGEAVPAEQEEEEEEEEPVGEQEEEEEEEEEEPVAGVPQYGGTLTLFARYDSDPPGPAMADAHRGSFHWLDFLLQRPIVGDWETYGPVGTGQWSFQLLGGIPEKYQKGLLLESWEVSLEKLVWHVRPGIYWAPTEKQSAWMEVRELTAEDIALDVKEFVSSAYGRRFDGLVTVEGVTVIDRYTLEIEFDERYSADVFYYIGYEDRAVVSAPEMVAAGAGKWENQCGTGPWMFEEYVIGSHMNLVRNPDYWNKTTIDGVEYQMPFIDRLVLTIIPDQATRVAALITGTIDLSRQVLSAQWSMVESTAPDLEKVSYLGSSTSMNLPLSRIPSLFASESCIPKTGAASRQSCAA